MYLYEKEILIPHFKGHDGLLAHCEDYLRDKLPAGDIPIRFVVTKTDSEGHHCELGVLSGIGLSPSIKTIFAVRKREFENTERFNAVLLVPTGIGAELGGHSGDAAPVARLLASCCDNLITHPNVVNASDINEMPENTLYVEGSVITRLLNGTVSLQKVRSNRIMLVMDKHEDKFFYEAAVNAASAARASMGIDIPLNVLMENKILMQALYSNSGRAVGKIEYFERLCGVLEEYKGQYDAVALSSIILVPKDFHMRYFKDDIEVNPWGGVEAILTHGISTLFNVPSAHSPMLESRDVLNLDVGMVDPRKAAEAFSTAFLHSIFKGLHKSPKIIDNPAFIGHPHLISATDVSCIVIPDGCIGIPTLAAMEQGIPVIAVRENKNRMQNRLDELPFEPGRLILVENYLEAVGVMNALKSGVSLDTVRRPLSHTSVVEYSQSIERNLKSPEHSIKPLQKKQRRLRNS